MKKQNKIISKHPYEPYISKDSTKLIIGSMPPPRFCTQPKCLEKGDIDWYYGSRDNSFWSLVDERLDTKNLNITKEDLQKWLNNHGFGITDLIGSCIHKDGKATDKSLIEIKYKSISKLLLNNSKIDTLICTSEQVRKWLVKCVDGKFNWSKTLKKEGTIKIGIKSYRVIVLYSPSPLCLIGIGKDGNKTRKNQYLKVFHNK